jgi:lipoprotein-anchoring transpeptidase ErfK/SrfK
MRSLFGCTLMLSALLAGSPLRAQESNAPAATPVSVANAPVPGEAGSAPQKASDVPLPSSLAAEVAQELSLPPPPAPITLVLKADLRAQRVTVEENGKLKHVWPISSGAAGFATRTGTFRPQWTSRMHYSRQYDFAPMPHAVFFNNGAAFHGTQAVGHLGRPASHGCIRLAPSNAAQLYNLVNKHGLYQTKVIVHGGSKESKVARRDPDAGKARGSPGRRDVNGGERRKRSRYGQYSGGSPWSFQ